MEETILFVALVDNDLITKSDAIILLEGDGAFRVTKAIDLLKNKWADKIVFSGGITDYSYGSYPFKDLESEFLNNNIDPSKIILEENSQNTLEQANNVIQMAVDFGWNKLLLVATHDHQYRAYLTFLKVLIDNNLNESIIIINTPARNLPWFKETGWGTRFNRLKLELEKIFNYGKSGHLATFSQAIDYQKTKEKKILEWNN